jgi:DNA-directed RNA polymerase specialized sigma24 family protein
MPGGTPLDSQPALPFDDDDAREDEPHVAQAVDAHEAEDAPAPEPSSTPSPAPAIEPWRFELLSDPSLLEHLRKVARLRGMQRADVDDVMNQVLMEALTDPNLPRTAGEIRKWLGVAARNKSVDTHRRHQRAPASLDTQIDPKRPATSAPTGAAQHGDVESLVADAAQLERLLALAAKRHPKAVGWAKRRYLDRDSVADIVEDARVDERTVRAGIQKVLAYCAALASSGIAMVLLFVGLQTMFLHPAFLVQDETATWMSTPTSRDRAPKIQHDPGPAYWRDRAREAIAAGRPDLAAAYLQTAQRLQPDETAAEKQLREQMEDAARRMFSKPPVR